MEQLLALFPLNVVLFPGATLPLHIFEPRYLQMIGRCMQLKQPFGVVLIRDGEPEGDAVAEPHEVGTSAVIQTVLKLEDGRLLLSAVGDQRFRVVSIIQREPYLVASVEYLTEEVTPEAADLAEQIRLLYARHREALSQAIGVEQHMDDLPDDPIALSYQLSAQFRVVDGSKQQLLEADLDVRLVAIIDALERELELLPQSSNGPVQSSSSPWSLN